MKGWSLLLGVVAAVGTAVAVTLLLRRADSEDGARDIPRLLEDCHDRIVRLESELQRLRPDRPALS